MRQVNGVVAVAAALAFVAVVIAATIFAAQLAEVSRSRPVNTGGLGRYHDP